MLAAHLALTGLPGVAAALAAMRLGARSVPVLLAIGLVGSGAAAFIAFWAYFADPTLGQAWNWVLLIGSIQVIVLSVWRGNLDRELLRTLRIPLLLWILGSVFIVYLGFIHGGTENPIGMSGMRYAGGLPSDNDIPRYFAEWFAAEGHHGTPPVYPPDWLMSDRPPLQVGYVLSQESITVADTQDAPLRDPLRRSSSSSGSSASGRCSPPPDCGGGRSAWRSSRRSSATSRSSTASTSGRS